MSVDTSPSDRDRFGEIMRLRASGHVRRWHTRPTLLGQDVAAHCAQALTLLLLLHPDPRMDLIRAVLWHDSGERVCGDAPSPGLERFKNLRIVLKQAELDVARDDHPTYHAAHENLSLIDRQWLRAVDLLELIVYCGDELLVGNQHFRVVLDRAVAWFRLEA